MNTPKYPNRDALHRALDTYLGAMYRFVTERLDQDEGTAAELIRDTLDLPSFDDIREIEVKNIAYLIRRFWHNFFQDQFRVIGQYGKHHYYDARTVTKTIVEGRNRVSHSGLDDLDSEFTRVQLFFIAEILGKINRPDKQREVEIIRDELFYDDTAERLAEAEEHLASVEEKNRKLSERNKELSKKELSKTVLDNAIKLDEKKKEIATTSRRLKAAESEKSEYKELNAALSQQVDDTTTKLDEEKAAHAACKDELKTTSERLEDAVGKRMACMEQLTVIRQLLTTAAIGDQSIFPPLDTNSAVRILDRRGTDKRKYLLDLLEHKQPAIVYVQDEEKVEQLLKFVGPEKEGIIGRHREQTSDPEEVGMLEELSKGELIAIVSSGTICTLLEFHCVKHFVFCHLAPDLDAFFERCQAAFTSAEDAYLHLIYNNKEDIEGLAQRLYQKYPKRETLKKLYRKLRELAEENNDFINPADIYNTFDMAKLGIETGLAIFEELKLLERNKDNIKLLSPSEKKLEESKIHCKGEELKEEVAEVHAFQLEQSIEQIWEKITK